MLSCILPSKPTRFAFAQRAILDFAAMRKESPGLPIELILVTGDEEYAARLRGFIAGLKLPLDWEVYVVFGRHSRNVYDCLTHGLCVAAGTHISFWDDADRHSHRWQHHMQYWCDQDQNSVLVPTRTLYHFYETQETYVCDFFDTALPLITNAVLSNVIYPRRSLPQISLAVREETYGKIFQEACKISHPVFPDQQEGSPWLHMVGVANDEKHDRHRAAIQGKHGVLSRKDFDAAWKRLSEDLKGFYGEQGRKLSLLTQEGQVSDYEFTQPNQCYPGRVLALPRYATESKESESDEDAKETHPGEG